MIQNIKRLCANSVATYQKLAVRHAELVKIRKKANLWQATPLSIEEERMFKTVWGGVNHKVDDRWHRYYKYFTGKFDEYYVPEILFSTIMEPQMNPRHIAEHLEDKAMLPLLYGNMPGLYVPQTIVVNCSGIYYDGDNNLLTKGKAMEIVSDYLCKHGKAIIKPTIGSSSGRNVRLIDNVKECEEYTQNWIVQEQIKNQDDIAELNKNSLNTLRVITYIVEDKICIAPVILRMGVGNTHLDNAHAGGIFVGINDDGSLCEEAYSEYGEKHKVHPHSKVVFAEHFVKNFDKLKDVAVKCHKLTPHLCMASWDLTINEDGIPTLIEANLYGQTIWFIQIAHGKSVFCENTEYMIKNYL